MCGVRLRRLLCGLLLVASASAGCSSDADPVGPAGPADAYRLTEDCPPPPLKLDGLTVPRLNDIVAGADLPGWQAGDIGASARLSDGRLVWLFGDTVRTDDHSPKIVGNSMLITSGYCITQLMETEDGPVIPDAGADTVLWPMSVVVLKPGEFTTDVGVADSLVVLCARTRRGTDGTFDFTYLGTSAAVFSVQPDQAPQLATVLEVTPDDADVHQVNWGAAAAVYAPWIYLYGTRSTEGAFGRELYVSRISTKDPADLARWQFWDGSGWQRDQRAAAAILPAEGGVSQTLSVDRIDGQFVAVSKRDGDLGNFVYTWTSETPYGPWTPKSGVPAPSGSDSGDLQYAPLAHPEISLADGKLLVSVSRNTADLERLLETPEVGRPTFDEVDRP